MSTLRTRTLAWLASIAASSAMLAGCLETVSCPQDRPNRVGGRCLADDMVDGGEPDSGEPDGGPCGPCSGDRPFCDEVGGTCVACITDLHCTSASAPRCAVGVCEPCSEDGDCGSRTGAPLCDEPSGACVACTPATETALCGAVSCSPTTGACTETPVGSIDPCGACIADSECTRDHRCIAMDLMGTPRGGYCLKIFDTGCAPGYGNPTEPRVSLSGAAAAQYCGIDEERTTCEAVLAFGRSCPGGADAECAPSGAVCGSVAGMTNRCSYPCVDSLQCPTARECPTGGGYCGG